MIPDDVRSTMLKYLDDARQSKEVIARHPATAEHKARAESEIARLTTAIEWALHQSSQRALVPSTELDAARQRIADLEAEVERLRQEQWTPVADGEYRCECDPACTSLLQIASDADSDAMAVWMRDEEQIGLVHLHGLRLCQRGAA